MKGAQRQGLRSATAAPQNDGWVRVHNFDTCLLFRLKGTEVTAQKCTSINSIVQRRKLSEEGGTVKGYSACGSPLKCHCDIS